MPAVFSNINNTTFWKGFIYGTIQGDPADSVRFGALQNVTLNHEWGLAQLRGPEALPPLAVGVTEENVTGTAEHATILASQARMITGATISVVSGNTRVRKASNTEPIPFDIHLESPDQGADIQVDLYRCLANTWQILRADTRAWMMSNFAFQAYGKAISGTHVLFDITLPGDQTDSTTSAGQPLAVS